MATTIVPYSQDYANRYDASGLASALGYGGDAAQAGVPYAPGQNVSPTTSVYSQAYSPYHDYTPDVAGAAGQSVVDPNAAAKAAASAAYGVQHHGILDSVGQAATNAGNQYKSGILDYLDSLKTGQNSINQRGVQAELSKQQGAHGILDYVSRGIQSGGTLLANKNATNSSASEAIARAYSMLGQRQMQGVGQQYALDQNAIGQSQDDLNNQVTQQGRHNEENKTNVVNSIVSDVSRQLQALDAAIAGASLPDRINIEAEKEQVRQQALAALQQYDQLFSQGVQGVSPSDTATRSGQANQLATAGVAATSPYQLTDQGPAQFAGTGSFNSNLPLFTLPRNRRTA